MPVPVYSCQGNSFGLVAQEDLTAFAMEVVARQIESDGLLVLAASEKADVGVRLLEKDGTESDLCGNGILCVAHHLWRMHRSRSWAIEMGSTIHRATVHCSRVTASFGRLESPARFVGPAASFVQSCEYVLRFNHHEETLYFVNSGEPHLFLLLSDMSQVDVGEYTRLISDPAIFPKGTNFSILAANGPFRIRTFERGVNGFTGSCGTGSIAAAQLLILLGVSRQKEFSFLSDGGVHEVTVDGDHVYLSGRVRRGRPYLLHPPADS